MESIDHEELHNLAEMLSQTVRAGCPHLKDPVDFEDSQIDFDSSQQENRVCIQSGIDETIDELSQLIEGESSKIPCLTGITR